MGTALALRRRKKARETNRAPSRQGIITVGKIPGGPIREIETPGAITVQTAFRKAGIRSLKGYEIQVSGKPAKLTTKVKRGAQVHAVAQVRGGSVS